MSDKVKVTWNGESKILPKDDDTFAKLDKMHAAGEHFTVEAFDEPAPVPANSGTYVDEMNVLGSNSEPLPVAPPKPAASAPSFGTEQFTEGAKHAGQALLDGYRRFTHAATLGFDDEAAGGMSAALNKVTGGRYGQSLPAAVRDARSANAEALRRSPAVSTVGDALGNVGVAAATSGQSALLPALRSLTPSASNVGLGMLQGVGNADGRNAALEAGKGAGIGLVAGKLGEGIEALAGKLKGFSLGARTSVGAPNKTMMKGLRERYGSSEAENFVGDQLERTFKPGPARSAQDYLTELQDVHLPAGQQSITALDRDVSAIGGDTHVPAAWEKFVQDLSAKAQDARVAAVGDGAINEANALKRLAKELTAVNKPKPGAAGPVQILADPQKAPATFAALREKIGQFGDSAFAPTASQLESAKGQANKVAWQGAKDAQRQVLDRLPTNLESRFDYTNRDFSDHKTLEHILDSTARGEQAGHLGAELASAIVAGGAGGLPAGIITGSPLVGTLTGIGGAAVSGTNSIAKRWTNSSGFRDGLANAADATAPAAQALARMVKNPAATTLAAGSVMDRTRQPEPFTSTGRVAAALTSNPGALGPYQQQLQGLEDEQLDRKVTELERNDQNFRAVLNQLSSNR